MRQHSGHARDAALRRLSRVNRWLIAGSVALTGVLTEVAAQAFPGRTLHTGSTNPKGATGSAAQAKTSTGSSTNSVELQPAKQAPESASGQESSGSQQSGSAGESSSSSESSSASESSKSSESSTGAESSGSSQKSSQESSAPVVSGGS